MGYGDELLASGMARGARARGKRIAFGDGKQIIWGPWSEPIFRNNPNVAPPGSERDHDIEWIGHYKGRRLYNTHSAQRWIWNYEFKPTPGELFFDDAEMDLARSIEPGFVLIEPNVPPQKSVAANKQWQPQRFQDVAVRLLNAGHRVVQLKYGGRYKLKLGVEHVLTKDFRQALTVLSRAKLFIGGEGGLHHGAAALGVPGVVLFGGFIPPEVTGYAAHINLTGSAVACGSLRPCLHCRKALDAISVKDVFSACNQFLSPEVPATSAATSASG